MIVSYTNLHVQREKADTSFKITNETFCLFLGMLLLSGCHKPPDRKMYMETIPDTFVQAMSDSIHRNSEIPISVTANNLINKATHGNSWQ